MSIGIANKFNDDEKEELRQQQIQINSIEEYKFKKKIKEIETYEGEKSCLVSLYISSTSQIALQVNFLKSEINQAKNIKLDKTKNYVIDAHVSAIEQLKLYKKIPKNGLAIFSGVVKVDGGIKEKMFKEAIEPIKPISKNYFICDKKFEIGLLKDMSIDRDKYGVVVMDGSGFLLATIQGNVKTVIYKESVDLPKKHGRGGQSANRFERNREIARNNYIRKIAETTKSFFTESNLPTVAGMILAGSADVKDEVYDSKIFVPCLRNIVLKIVDINYGEENGLSQAVDLCTDVFKNVQYSKEKQAMQHYF